MTNNQHDIVKTFVVSKFKGLKDKGGNDYVEHLLYVSEHAYTIAKKSGLPETQAANARLVGLMHDVLEDTECTYSDLFKVGLNGEQVRDVVTLTRRPGVSYKQYLDVILSEHSSQVSRIVKMVDCYHNSQVDRLGPSPTTDDIERCKKYKKRAQKLLDKLNEDNKTTFILDVIMI